MVKRAAIIVALMLGCLGPDRHTEWRGIPSGGTCARRGDVSYSRIWGCVAAGREYTCIEQQNTSGGCHSNRPDYMICAPTARGEANP